MIWDVTGTYTNGERFHFTGSDLDRLAVLISRLDASGTVSDRQVWKNGDPVTIA